MGIPEIAYRSFLRLKTDPRIVKIVKKVILSLRKMKDPIARARYIHSEVDSYLDSLFKNNPMVKPNLSCKKGCTYCCHTQVSVTSDEASLLAKIVESKQVEIDRTRLYQQAQAGANYNYWMQIPYEQRKCVFIGKDGGCSIYEDRPSVCRTNYALSPAEDCDTSDGTTKQMRLLKTEIADVVVATAYTESEENGTLPFMLDKKLKEKLTIFSK